MSGFEVVNGGILTLLQDKGRFGYASLGVTSAGVMDEFAYLCANSFLGNDLDTNVLEIAFSGLKLKATAPCMICVTGADLSFSINDKVYEPWRTFVINAGDEVKFSKNITGVRAYLAVKGGFDIPKEFESNATTLKESLGGIEGRAVKTGDFLPFKSSRLTYNKILKKKHRPNYDGSVKLRVILSYQEEHFSMPMKEKFFSESFEVSNEANRMGIKLKGEAIIPDISGIVSEGIAFGSIQVPSDGQPIVLLKDRQTIGGYAKIGTVIPTDCFKLSQAKPGTSIHFEAIHLEEALKEHKAFYEQFNTL